MLEKSKNDDKLDNLGQTVSLMNPQEWEFYFTERKEGNTGEKTSGQGSGDLDDLDKIVSLKDPQEWESSDSLTDVDTSSDSDGIDPDKTADLTEEVTKIREQLGKEKEGQENLIEKENK